MLVLQLTVGILIVANNNAVKAFGLLNKEERFVDWVSRSVWEEVPYPGRELEVIGHIPSYVNGVYIKNGPGAFETRDGSSRRYSHIFDGFAKLQKFDIHNGGVSFCTQFLNTKSKRAAFEKNKTRVLFSVGPVYPSFGNNIFKTLFTILQYDNANVDLEELSSTGTYVATTDARLQVHVDPETLQIITQEQQQTPRPMRKKQPPPIKGIPRFFPHVLAVHGASHNKVARRDGLSYRYILEQNVLTGKNKAHIVRVNSDLTMESIGSVPANPKKTTTGSSSSRTSQQRRHRYPMVHEISVTDNYAILVIYPLWVNFFKALRKGNFFQASEFYADQNTRIYLFDLNQKRPVQVFEAPPCFAYHHVNAYERQEQQGNHTTTQVVLDIVAYENGDFVCGEYAYLYLDKLKTEEQRFQQEREGTVWRFVMDLSSSSSTTSSPEEEVIPFVEPQKKMLRDPDTKLPLTMDLVSISPTLLGKSYRKVYGFTDFHRGQKGFLDWALLKQDVETNHLDGVWYQDGMYPGEVKFVPDPDGTKEDEGVLLATVYDSIRGENFLLVLNAATMKEVARAYTGIACPQSFHGHFIPSSIRK